MYFDTLKVSTVEQTASQSSARGGLGNPELITWDFGKEITVTLEDALYTPASQSLMWGGKFGIKKTKIYGVWNPFVYPTDRSGRQIYIKREPIELGLVDDEDSTYWIVRIAYSNIIYDMDTEILKSVTIENADINIKDVDFGTYTPISQKYFYTWDSGTVQYGVVVLNSDNELQFIKGTISDDTFSLIGEAIDATVYTPQGTVIFINCPCDGIQKAFLLEEQDGHYKYCRIGFDQKEDQLILSYDTCPSDNQIVDSEESQNIVGKYTISANYLNDPEEHWVDSLIPERALLTIDAFGQFQYQAYQLISIDHDEDRETEPRCYYKDIDFCDSNDIRCTDEPVDAYGYIWEDSDLKMTSLEGSQDLFYLEGVDLRYRIRVDNGQREVSLEYYLDKDNEGYQPKIDVFKNISYTTINDLGVEEKVVVRVLAGTFYIIDDWNLNGAPPQDYIYEIESGLNNVDYLERTEKCRAKQTFAIDADKNIRCSNYRYDHAYDNSELTVFIDPNTMKPYESNADYFQTRNGDVVEGNLTIIKQNQIYLKWTRRKAPDYASLGYQIIVDAEHYPGTYKLVGETYTRAYSDGQDRRYQIEIPLCKMSAETNFTLEAAGDPTTFNMTFKVLRKDDGTMMKLTQYDVTENAIGSTDLVTTDVIQDESIFTFDSAEPDYTIQTIITPSVAQPKTRTYTITNPLLTGGDNARAYVDEDSDAPNEVIPTFIQASDGDLEQIVSNRGRVTETLTGPNGEKYPIYDEQINQTYNYNGNPYVTPIQETVDYEISHDEYQARVDQYGNETEIPNTRVTIDEGTTTSTRFLSDEEYTISGGDN